MLTLDLLIREVKLDTSYGGYLQATYDFGQGTNLGYSYGQNKQVLTGEDSGQVNRVDAGGGRTNALQNYVESHIGMLWHNVTDDFRLIAEGSYTESHWYMAGSQRKCWRICWCVLFLVDLLPTIYYTLKGDIFISFFVCMIKYLFTVLISLFLTSCSSYEDISGFFSDEKIYFLSQYENVKAVEQDSQSTGVNSHPLKLAKKELQVHSDNSWSEGPKTITLFPGDKIELISEAISKALAEVGPKEDVVFTIESWYREIPGKKLSDNRVVSGRVFYNKDGLNLIFGSV